MSAERWSPIPGHEGRYDVSDYGRVRSWIAKNGQPLPFRLTPAATRSGHLYITLVSSDGRHRTHRVHVLMMLAFAGSRPNGYDIRHLDGNPRNNVLANLAYGTKSENVLDSVRHGTHNFAGRSHCKHGHEYTPENTSTAGGFRQCLTCHRESSRCYRARKKAAA